MRRLKEGGSSGFVDVAPWADGIHLEHFSDLNDRHLQDGPVAADAESRLPPWVNRSISVHAPRLRAAHAGGKVGGPRPNRSTCFEGTRVIEISLTALVAGTKYRGEFEERMEA